MLEDVDFEWRAARFTPWSGKRRWQVDPDEDPRRASTTPDAGQIVVMDGRPVSMPAHEARQLGIAMIMQEFSLLPYPHRRAEHLARPGATGSRGLIDDRDGGRAGALELASMERRPGSDSDRGRPDRTDGSWQLIEIAKALAQHADPDHGRADIHPDAAETQSLFALMQTLKAQGISIIYISHRMEEIFEIADRVTVLRDGRRISTTPTAELTMHRVIDDIVGRTMESAFAWQERRVERTGTPSARGPWPDGGRPPS